MPRHRRNRGQSSATLVCGTRHLDARVRIRSLLFALSHMRDQFRIFYTQYLLTFGAPSKSARPNCDLLAALLKSRWIYGISIVQGAKLIGFCIYSRTYSPMTRSRAFSLDDIFVAQSFRRAGLASLMINALAERARALDVMRIYVNTDASDRMLMRFYSRNGFVNGNASILLLRIN